MGSAMSAIDCPNCEQEAFEDFYYKTGEIFVHCPFCGYSYEAYIESFEEGKDPSFKETECKKPYCLIKATYKNNIRQNITIKTKKDFEKTKAVLKDAFTPEEMPNIITAHRYARKKFQKRTLYNNGKFRNSKFKF